MDETRPTGPSAIRRDFDRVSPAIVQQASGFAASILADVAGRRGTMDGRITPLTPGTRLAGPAFTIEVRPGDNLMIHAAMAMARPGDILVVDGKADTSCALMGAIMITACKALGLGGVILDGAHRDTEELVALGFPVLGGHQPQRANQEYSRPDQLAGFVRSCGCQPRRPHRR